MVILLQRVFPGFARKRRWWGKFAVPQKTALFLIILAAEYTEIFLLPFFFSSDKILSISAYFFFSSAAFFLSELLFIASLLAFTQLNENLNA